MSQASVNAPQYKYIKGQLKTVGVLSQRRIDTRIDKRRLSTPFILVMFTAVAYKQESKRKGPHQSMQNDNTERCQACGSLPVLC